MTAHSSQQSHGHLRTVHLVTCHQANNVVTLMLQPLTRIPKWIWSCNTLRSRGLACVLHFKHLFQSHIGHAKCLQHLEMLDVLRWNRGNKKLTLARYQTQSVWVEFQSQRMNGAFSTTFILNIEECEGGWFVWWLELNGRSQKPWDQFLSTGRCFTFSLTYVSLF